METKKEKKWGRLLRKAIAMIVTLLVTFLCVVAEILVIEQIAQQGSLVYPEEAYRNMEEFAKEVILPNKGIDEEKLILESEYDFEYIFSQGQGGNPKKALNLINREQSQLRDPIRITVNLDERYQIVSIRRDTIVEEYPKEYFKWRAFQILCGVVIMFAAGYLYYMIWKF